MHNAVCKSALEYLQAYANYHLVWHNPSDRLAKLQEQLATCHNSKTAAERDSSWGTILSSEGLLVPEINELTKAGTNFNAMVELHNKVSEVQLATGVVTSTSQLVMAPEFIPKLFLAWDLPLVQE